MVVGVRLLRPRWRRLRVPKSYAHRCCAGGSPSRRRPRALRASRTRDGLLLFYRQREQNGQYTIRVALLDDENSRVKSVLPDPIMCPELAWELNGDVDDLVFIQGAVPRPDGTIYLA